MHYVNECWKCRKTCTCVLTADLVSRVCPSWFLPGPAPHLIFLSCPHTFSQSLPLCSITQAHLATPVQPCPVVIHTHPVTHSLWLPFPHSRDYPLLPHPHSCPAASHLQSTLHKSPPATLTGCWLLLGIPLLIPSAAIASVLILFWHHRLLLVFGHCMVPVYL